MLVDQPGTDGLHQLLHNQQSGVVTLDTVANSGKEQEMVLISDMAEKLEESVSGHVENTSTTSKLNEDHGRPEDNDNTCPICYEPLTSTGDHRVSSLKCGHLFGLMCITKWVTRNHGSALCPQCNTKARKVDIRPLYAASIKVIDTCERDQFRVELEKEREARRKLELEVAASRLRYQQALAELGRLRDIVDQYNHSSSHSNAQASVSGRHCSSISGTASSTRPSLLTLEKVVPICQEGNCRVMISLEYCSMIVISQPNLNPLFPGYGLKKLNSLEYRAYEFIAVHSKPIRDVAHNAKMMDGLVLTASLDKKLKLTSMMSNTNVQTYEADCPVWSCTWNLDNPYQYFAGLANGLVLLLDTRKPSERILDFRCSESRSPVISLQYVGFNQSASFSCGGLLVCQLDGCYFCKATMANDFHVNPLSADKGPWTSMSYEPHSCHMMISCRPNVNCQSIRHLVCELTETPLDVHGQSICQSNVVQTFYGGTSHKTLSRSLLLRCPSKEDNIMALANDESSSSIILWDVNSASSVLKLPVTTTVMDICPITVNGRHFLGALSEKVLNVYSWEEI